MSKFEDEIIERRKQMGVPTDQLRRGLDAPRITATAKGTGKITIKAADAKGEMGA